MKKALVMTLALVLGLGVAAFAGSLSGSWESELSIGFRDATVTYPGQTFIIPGRSLTVTQGSVYVPAEIITWSFGEKTYSYTIEAANYLVGPFSFTVKGGTFDVIGTTVTIPTYDLEVIVEGGTCTVTVPEITLETPLVPLMHDKEADVELFAGIKDITVPEPKAYYEYSGDVEYDYVVQSGAVILQEGSGTFNLGAVTLAVAKTAITTWPAGFDWTLLCWEGFAPVILHAKADVNLYPVEGKHFQVYFPPFEVKVKCLDLADPWKLMLEGRTATGFDQNNNTVTIMLRDHFITLSADDTTMVKIPATVNYAYTPEMWEEQHWLFVKIPPTDFIVRWPNWPRCCTDEDPRPEVTIVWEDEDTAVYQYDGTEEELELIKADVEAHHEAVLDKIGFGFLNTTAKDYPVDTDGHIIIPQGDMVGEFLLGSYVVGWAQIIIPARQATGTYDGQKVTVIVPEQTGVVTEGAVTLEDQVFEITTASVDIPDLTVLITVDGQSYTKTIYGYTIIVSGQTATLPPLTVTIDPYPMTIYRIPTLGFSSTLIVDYTVCGWIFTSTSKFSEEGWTDQSFAAVGSLGAFGFASDLVFDPVGAAFTSWNTTVSVSIAGVTFDTGFLLEAAGSGLTFGVSGSAGACLLAATAYFNTELDADGNLVVIGDIFCFCFTSVEFDISFPFACIDLVDISLGFSEAGFDGVTFSIVGLAIPNIPWLTFDVDLTFATGVTGKTLSITPVLNFGTFTCITIYGELLGDFPEITGYNIYGIGLTYTWNGITFSSLSALAPGWYVTSDVALDDEGTYWEAFSISSEADACCGGLLDFSVITFFDKNSAMLFDWGETSVKLSIGLGGNYTGWTGLTVSDAGFDQWTLGFKVTW